MKTVVNKIGLIYLWALYLPFTLTAQTYDLDKVKSIPSIDESNMKIIATSVWILYGQALKDPIKFSNSIAADDTVYAFKDFEINDKYEKLSWVRGKQYTLCNRDELDSNNRLLFNLKFDVTGKLIIPEKLYVISHRQETLDGVILTKGCRSFELKVTDSIKAELEKVKLERVVLGRIGLKGEYTPVEIKIPFNLSHLESSQSIKVKLVINKKRFDIFSEEKGLIYDNDTNLIKAMLEFLEYKLLQYKKAQYTFGFVRDAEGLQIDMNIRRHNIWTSQQTKNFPAFTYRVVNFEGKGVKCRYYRKVRKKVELKLKHNVKHWPGLDK
ncbi:MAG: hypothetical protein H7296_13915 [Bacteroidia bacterium]|nr:hypothetical protein [Bacteroidia bacterium]